MSNKIQIKRGLKDNLPILDSGEPGFTTDTKEFFIGDGSTNIEFAKQVELEITNTKLSELTNKVDNIKIADGTTSQKGIVKLNDTVTSTSIIEAATANAVRQAYARADSAFTSANNGKTSIANVVGTVTGSNTFGEIANEIQTDKNILANNLTNKGVSASGNSSLKSLSNAVANITVQSMGGIIPLTGSFNNYVSGRTYMVNYNTFYNSAYNMYFIRGAYSDLSMFFVFSNGKMYHRKFTSITSQLITSSNPIIELRNNSSTDATIIPWSYIGFNIDQSFFPTS